MNWRRTNTKSLWGPKRTFRIHARDTRYGPTEFLACLDEMHCMYCVLFKNRNVDVLHLNLPKHGQNSLTKSVLKHMNELLGLGPFIKPQ